MRRAGGGNAVGLIAWRRQYYQRRRCSGISAAAAAAAAATVLYCIIHLRRCAASQMTRSLISVVTGHLAPGHLPPGNRHRELVPHNLCDHHRRHLPHG